jgi:hypothetical protein
MDLDEAKALRRGEAGSNGLERGRVDVIVVRESLPASIAEPPALLMARFGLSA